MKSFSDEIVKNTIRNNIKNQNTVFIFSTQIAADMWADAALDFSGVDAVAMERFIAWDRFKGSSIKSHQADKTSVPSTMRLVFAQNIIKQNAEKPFLKSIVRVEFAKTATRFASWIADILPSLAMWKNHFEKSGCTRDEDDDDYYEIYNRYKKFLDDNNLFDPAWETPPFISDGKKYIIFFPEILMDYSEYQELLESTEDIELVHIPEDYYKKPKPDGHLYSNTRVELKEVVNYLWKKHDEEKIAWNKIAISVPDSETYGPYLERDLELYQIPHIIKNGKALSSAGAGKLFRQLLNCYSENFSFASVKNLLMNKELPWNDDEVIDLLIKFGQKNNCFCSFEYKGEQVDVWQKSFSEPVKRVPCKDERDFYKDLNRYVNSVVSSKSFSEIRLNYFKFREKFFNFRKESFSVQNDKILSRCIAELGSLIDLELKYKDSNMFEMENCFSFFCDYLDDKMYVPQNEEQGVAVLPYKTAAMAPFDLHVVVDASQNSASVVYKKLQFLRNDKRVKLGFVDEDNVTEDFILLYAMTSQHEPLFTCSSKTINGYAFTNSYLTEKNHNPKKEYADKTFITDDSYRMEKDAFVDCEENKFPKKIFAVEKEGFDNFIKLNGKMSVISEKDKEKYFEKIKQSVYQNNIEKPGYSLIKASATGLNKFFKCPRAYAIETILDVKEADNAAQLIGIFTKGTVNHSILENYFKKLKEKNLEICVEEGSLEIPESYKEILFNAVKASVNNYNFSYMTCQILETEIFNTQNAILNTVNAFSRKFNHYKVSQIEKEYNFVSENQYVINCIIDCLLVSPDGEYVLVDFKSSANSIPKKKAFLSEDVDYPDFQMPLYKYVLAKQERPVNVKACVFYDIKNGSTFFVYTEIKELLAGQTKDPAKLEQKMNDINAKFNPTQKACIDNVDLFVKAVRENDFSLSVVEVPFENCRDCSYKAVCRRIFTINQKGDEE